MKTSIITLLATCVAASQAVTLFEHSEFNGTFKTFPNNCNCTNVYEFSDRASSAFLPFGKITFYEHDKCEGKSKTWNGKTDFSPSNFENDGINDMITSFFIYCGPTGGRNRNSSSSSSSSSSSGCTKCGQDCCK